MRIRSIKPEFWRSDDISALNRDDRLLFIGIWSYVDDNGVGRDQVPIIAADLFAQDLSIDPTETLMRVSTGLERLYNAGLIVRYKAPYGGHDRNFLEVTKWADHQRIQHPGKSRYPRSDKGEPNPTETLMSPSGAATETLAPGAGEQGSRGAGDIPASADAEADVRPTVEEQFEQWYAKYPRKKDRGHAVKAFKAALKKTDLDTLMAGLDAYLAQIAQERTEPRHIAYPATWLNGERWDDETAQVTPERPKHPDAPDNRTVFEMSDEEFAERERIHRERLQAKRDAMATG